MGAPARAPATTAAAATSMAGRCRCRRPGAAHLAAARALRRLATVHGAAAVAAAAAVPVRVA
eukprot:230778-Chlamydomonas_euryale.AAC.2